MSYFGIGLIVACILFIVFIILPFITKYREWVLEYWDSDLIYYSFIEGLDSILGTNSDMDEDFLSKNNIGQGGDLILFSAMLVFLWVVTAIVKAFLALLLGALLWPLTLLVFFVTLGVMKKYFEKVKKREEKEH